MLQLPCDLLPYQGTLLITPRRTITASARAVQTATASSERWQCLRICVIRAAYLVGKIKSPSSVGWALETYRELLRKSRNAPPHTSAHGSDNNTCPRWRGSALAK